MQEQNDELVAAYPVSQSSGISSLQHAFSDLYERVVTGLVPESIIQLLKSVHIQGSNSPDAFVIKIAVIVECLSVQERRQRISSVIVRKEYQVIENTADYDRFVQPDTAWENVQQRSRQAKDRAHRHDIFFEAALFGKILENDPQDQEQIEDRYSESDIAQRTSVERIILIVSECDISKKRRAAYRKRNDVRYPENEPALIPRNDHQQKAERRRGAQGITDHWQEYPEKTQWRVRSAYALIGIFQNKEKAA